jgi:hypothetical protein
MKEGKSIDITAEPRMRLNDNSLQIKDLVDEDAGEYACAVRTQDEQGNSVTWNSSPASLQIYGCYSITF